jgi:transposase
MARLLVLGVDTQALLAKQTVEKAAARLLLAEAVDVEHRQAEHRLLSKTLARASPMFWAAMKASRNVKETDAAGAISAWMV